MEYHNHIVLFEPEIPSNTGNIARTCAGTDTQLHLIRPLAFSTSDRSLKRAGLDYWDQVKVTYHDSLPDFMESLPKDSALYLLTKFADKSYTDVDFKMTSDNYLLFGRETTGLPKDFMEKYQDRCLRIPMNDKIRALNLANSAAIVIYEALRQQNFSNLELSHHYLNDKLKDN